MDLYKEQRNLQIGSYISLQKKIDILLKNKNSHLHSFAKAGELLSYIQKYIKKLEEFILEYLQEVVSKVIQQDNNYYASILGVNYKNIHDAIAKPITLSLFNKSNFLKSIEKIKNSKQEFINMEDKLLKEKVTIVLYELNSQLSIGGDIYNSLSQEKNILLKKMPQRVALAIWQLGTNEIVNMVTIHLLSLLQKDNSDDDNSANSRQSFGGAIGEEIHSRIAYRFLRDIENLRDKELKKAYRLYNNGNFDSLKQCSKYLISNKNELEIGQKMLDLAIEVDIIKEYNKPNDDKNFNYLKLNSQLLEKMSNSDKKIAYSASMVYKPMVIEPLDWKDMYGGGFLADENLDRRFDLSFIKTSNKKDREALEGKSIPKDIFKAVNIIQKTSFKINYKILNVLNDYADDIRNLKSKNSVDFAYYRILRELLASDVYSKSKKQIEKHFKTTKYIKLIDGELSKTDKKRINKALKHIKKSSNIGRFKLNSEIYYNIAKYKQGFNTIMQIAKEMQKFKQFYFVWRMDFRGRLYPEQTLLNPQSGDIPKALLLFSKEQKINSRGLEWFFIHGANCYGKVDKEPFDSRIKWIKDRHNSILNSAKNYREESFWKKADEPFKFLAWCFEYERYIQNPNNFTTSIPIAIDGSNNGFQHITVLLKDIEGAKMVNVLPSYDRDNRLIVNDFYAEVAEELKKLIEYKILEFKSIKEKLILKNGVYYKIEKKTIFKPEYNFKEIVDYLKKIDIDRLIYGQYFITYLLKNIEWKSNFKPNELESIKKYLMKIEREIRSEIGEDDLEEIQYSIVDRLEALLKRIERAVKKGKLSIKDGKAFGEEEIYKLKSSSLYKDFLDRGLIKRSFVKGAVMTESYGSSTNGKAKNILEKIEVDGILSYLDEDNRYLVAFEITKLLEKALSNVSSSPRKYKNWMKKYAKDIIKTNNPITWKTPLGLEVKQVDFNAEKVKISIDGGRKVEFKIYNNKLNEKAHKQGFSPNYIHSLDATHLIITVNRLKEIGIEDIVTVHDSFATHANDVDKMSIVLRESFIELHKKDILPELCKDFKKNYNIEEKKIPYVNRDKFNLKETLKSQYFFA